MLKYPPWQTLTKDNQGNIVASSGLIFEVMDQISRKLNFSYSVREPADGLWGAQVMLMMMIMMMMMMMMMGFRWAADGTG